MTTWIPDATSVLPADHENALLVGRVHTPDGPSVVTLRGEDVIDLSQTFPTMTALTELADPAAATRAATGTVLGTFDEIWRNTDPDTRDENAPYLLSPVDLQVIKASGVTFPVSMLERVIEERARGEASSAQGIRETVQEALGGDIADLVPGSPAAMRLKEVLIEQDLWSQYLEVGIGPDAEIFSKAPVLSSVGTGDDIGVLAESQWNPPSPGR